VTDRPGEHRDERDPTEEHGPVVRDKRRREEAEVRNTGDQLVYQTEKFLADNADKFAEGDAAATKAEVEDALAELKKALEGTDEAAIPAIKDATEKVATISQKLGAAMYAEAQAAGAGDAGGGPGADASGGQSGQDDSDVVDAEIVDEDEPK
jgi:molecular chaperone DnaK